MLAARSHSSGVNERHRGLEHRNCLAAQQAERVGALVSQRPRDDLAAPTELLEGEDADSLLTDGTRVVRLRLPRQPASAVVGHALWSVSHGLNSVMSSPSKPRTLRVANGRS